MINPKNQSGNYVKYGTNDPNRPIPKICQIGVARVGHLRTLAFGFGQVAPPHSTIYIPHSSILPTISFQFLAPDLGNILYIPQKFGYVIQSFAYELDVYEKAIFFIPFGIFDHGWGGCDDQWSVPVLDAIHFP